MAGMPWQLKEGLERFRKEKRKPRPIAELLPSISVNDLRIPTDDRVYTLPNASLRWPFLTTVRLSWDAAEFNYPSYHRGQSGRQQVFAIKPAKVGYGTRYYFRCDCQKGAAKLYYCNNYLACKRCHRVR